MGDKVVYAIDQENNSTSKHGVQCGVVSGYWGNPIGEK
jgi:hypothetical protein